jgi:hypothetical protein
MLSGRDMADVVVSWMMQPATRAVVTEKRRKN